MAGLTSSFSTLLTPTSTASSYHHRSSSRPLKALTPELPRRATISSSSSSSSSYGRRSGVTIPDRKTQVSSFGEIGVTTTTLELPKLTSMKRTSQPSSSLSVNAFPHLKPSSRRLHWLHNKREKKKQSQGSRCRWLGAVLYVCKLTVKFVL